MPANFRKQKGAVHINNKNDAIINAWTHTHRSSLFLWYHSLSSIVELGKKHSYTDGGSIGYFSYHLVENPDVPGCKFVPRESLEKTGQRSQYPCLQKSSSGAAGTDYQVRDVAVQVTSIIIYAPPHRARRLLTYRLLPFSFLEDDLSSR